jgi:hypothetical protein
VDSNISGWFRWLEASSWAVTIRQSLWLYPILEIVHIVGIVLVAGAAILFDLRLLGVSGRLPVTGMAKHLLPWSKRGLLLVIPSGILLFITNAETLGYDPTFHLKLIFLAFAGINAILFHVFIFRRHIKNNQNSQLPRIAKLNAIFSIVIWITIIACGRLLAY